MSIHELVAEIRAAAGSLLTAAVAAEEGDLAAAEIGVEDALFRAQSILPRLQSVALDTPSAPPPSDPSNK